MLPPHKTLKPKPKKSLVTPRTSPAAKSALIDDVAEDLKVRSLKQKVARVVPAPLRVLGEKSEDAAASA